MKRAWVNICSVWSWFVLGACIVLWVPIMSVLRLLTRKSDPGRYWVGYAFRQIAVVTATLNPLWRFRISGVIPLDPRKPYVAVSNHESFVDILLISHLPWEMKWLSKAELFRIPVLGWLMRLAGDIPVDRSSSRSAIEAMQRCKVILGQNVSVIIFPEGTRSTTDEMLPFKDGAFRLAVDAGVAILPMAVSGAATALPKHDWHFGKSVAEVRVLEPVETTGLGRADIPALRDRVREMIVRARDDMRNAQARIDLS
jgi:1-acyl-sn-glycerol-3-phosphate acyltransferase